MHNMRLVHGKTAIQAVRGWMKTPVKIHPNAHRSTGTVRAEAQANATTDATGIQIGANVHLAIVIPHFAHSLRALPQHPVAVRETGDIAPEHRDVVLTHPNLNVMCLAEGAAHGIQDHAPACLKTPAGTDPDALGTKELPEHQILARDNIPMEDTVQEETYIPDARDKE